MKFVLLLAVVAFAVVSSQEVSQKDLDSWNEFKVMYQKNYPDPMEDEARMKIYLQNLKQVEEHNKRFKNGEISYSMDINQFSDWYPEERNQLLGHIPN